MKRTISLLARRYESALRVHLKAGRSSPLRSAASLGRQAASLGLETLDLARIHERALINSFASQAATGRQAALIQRAQLFFIEVITPIEQTHQGARDAAVQSKQLNKTLRRRTAELAASNEELRHEIERRAEIETALRTSERHYSQSLKESARLQEQLRYLSHQILSTQEEERKKISRELHDQIATTLAAIDLQLNALKREAIGSSTILRRKIARTQHLVKNSVEIIHRFARDLRPPTLDDLGLIPALHSLAKAFSKRTGIRVRLNVFAGVEELSNAKRTVLYRVAQEALANVAKHSRATRVQMNILKLSDAVALSINDDGKSFSVQRVLSNRKNRRLGLLGMRERVEMVGGKFALESEPRKGTTVHATIPLRDPSSGKPPRNPTSHDSI